MKEISEQTTREQLAAIVVSKLGEHNIKAILVGGSVVSIYTANKYESNDLDFVSPSDHRKITTAMEELGFKAKGKDFYHPNTKLTVEFPARTLGIGDDMPVIPEGQRVVDGITVTMLSPTQSIMDRLAGYFHCGDMQNLDQAVWIAEALPEQVSIERIIEFAKRERSEEKLKVFLNRLKK
jgi:hypothetical protein